MTDLEQRLALLRSGSLMVPTTDPSTTCKRPAEEASSKPSSKKTKHTTETRTKSQLYAHPTVQCEFLRLKAELQKKDQELAAEKAKSLENNTKYRTQIKLLFTQCCTHIDRSNAILASHATFEAANHELTSELRAHKGALNLTRQELNESRKETDVFYKAITKQDEQHKLVKQQLKEAKEDEVVQWRMLTHKLHLLGKSNAMGRAVYDMLLLQVEEQYCEDEVVRERVKRALKEAFGGFFGGE